MKLKMLILSSKLSYSPDQSIKKLTKPIEFSILHIVLGLPGICVYLQKQSSGANYKSDVCMQMFAPCGMYSSEMKYAGTAMG